jgi:hypothetical protein
LPEEGVQPKSQAKPANNDDWLDEPVVQNKKAPNAESTKPKKKKNKNKK